MAAQKMTLELKITGTLDWVNAPKAA